MTMSEPAFMDLDTAVLGDLLLRLPAVSAMLRHASLKMTLHYICPEGTGHEREVEFIEDILDGSTDEICEKWYGGNKHAAACAVHLTAHSIAEARGR